MQHLLDSLTRALANKNWYAALFMALTLPDICGKIQYPEVSSSETRYVQWFEKYLGNKYTREVGPSREKDVFLSGEDCYALRCSLLHEGIDVISHQRCKKVLDSFLFVASGGIHCNYFSFANGHTFLQLSVKKFCEDVCASVQTWLNDVASDNTIQKRLSETIKIEASADRYGVHFENRGS